jgi:hypothetical protein
MVTGRTASAAYIQHRSGVGIKPLNEHPGRGKKMNNRMLVAAATVACFLSLSAHAAGGAVIRDSENNRISLEYTDGKLRVQPQDRAEGAMIMRDGKAYVLMGDTVMDMGAMMRTFGQQAGMAPSAGPDNVSRFIALRDTGRSESIAGISGRVHELEYQDEDGRTRKQEMVLSNDARARELAAAFKLMSDTMRDAMGKPATAEDARIHSAMQGRGILRFGQDFQVVSFSSGAPAASRFELPSAPQSMPDMGASGQQGAGESGGGLGSALGGMFGDRAKRQQERAEQRTDREVDEATDTAVDKALDRAFGRIFGNK